MPTRQATAAERALLTILDGGCQAPLGAFADWVAAGRLSLDAIVLNDTGTRLLRATAERPVEAIDDSLALAANVAACWMLRAPGRFSRRAGRNGRMRPGPPSRSSHDRSARARRRRDPG